VTAPTVTSPDEYASQFSLALRIDDMGRDRAIQFADGRLGASDALSCAQKAVFTIGQEPATNAVRKGQALRGTYLHAGTLAAVGKAFPNRIIETELTVTLPSGITLTVHPDEIDPDEPSVTDYKFVADLAYVRRTGSSDQQKAQTALQYLAAHQNGLVPAEGMVRNLFVSCDDLDDRHVTQEPFDLAWIDRADEWLGEVAYAVAHGEEARKEWPIPMCRSYCPWFTRCRGEQIAPVHKIEDPDIIRAAHTYRQAKDEIKELEALAKAAATHLPPEVEGEADGLRVRSVWVNPSEPKMSRGRAGSWRLEVTPL
jgi:hypothetical protein